MQWFVCVTCLALATAVPLQMLGKTQCLFESTAAVKAFDPNLSATLAICEILDSTSKGTISGTQERFNCNSKTAPDSVELTSFCAVCTKAMIGKCKCVVTNGVCSGPNVVSAGGATGSIANLASAVGGLVNQASQSAAAIKSAGKDALSALSNIFQNPVLPDDIIVMYKTRVNGTRQELFDRFDTNDMEQCVDLTSGPYVKYCVGKQGWLFKDANNVWVGTRLSMTESPDSKPIRFAVTRPPDDPTPWCKKIDAGGSDTQYESKCVANPKLSGLHPGSKGWTWCFQGDAYNGKESAPPPAGCFKNYRTENCAKAPVTNWRLMFVCVLADPVSDPTLFVDPKFPPGTPPPGVATIPDASVSKGSPDASVSKGSPDASKEVAASVSKGGVAASRVAPTTFIEDTYMI